MPIPAGFVTTAPGLVERTVGAAVVVVTIAGAELPASALGPVSIGRGRVRPDQRPVAAACSMVLSTVDLPALPRLGDAVTVDLTPAAVVFFDLDPAAVPRFRGKVSDLDAAPVDEVTGAARIQLVATGPRAELETVDVGADAYPAETAGDRADRVLDEVAADVPGLVVGYVDADPVDVAARAGSVTKAAALLDELSVTSGGELVELRDGSLVWQDVDHRDDLTPAVTLYAGQVLASCRWRQDRAGLLNDVTVTYSGGDVRVVDAGAIDEVGIRAAQTVATVLPDALAATSRGIDLVGRFARPRWRLDQLPVDVLRTLDPATAAAVLAADYGDVIEVRGFPTTGPFVESRLFLEGSVETFTRHAWQLALNVSEAGLTAPAPRWIDVPDSVTWADVPTDLTWLGAVGWSLPVGGDRWSDQPGNLRWSGVDDTATWATY